VGHHGKVAQRRQVLDPTDCLPDGQPAFAGDRRQIQDRTKAIVAGVLSNDEEHQQSARARGAGLPQASPDKTSAH